MTFPVRIIILSSSNKPQTILVRAASGVFTKGAERMHSGARVSRPVTRIIRRNNKENGHNRIFITKTLDAIVI
jgi:hypothetical protein